jgi:16S rRNA G966 N2-methylase RsmD
LHPFFAPFFAFGKKEKAKKKRYKKKEEKEKMLLIIVFILIIVIATFFVPLFHFVKKKNEKKGGGQPIEQLLTNQQDEYLADIQNGKLIFEKVPDTFGETRIVSFPYIKYFLPFKHLQEIYNEIKTTVIEIDYNPYDIADPIINSNNTKFVDKWITFSKSYQGFYFIALIDYFQEECRMRCRRVNAKTDFLTFFQGNRMSIGQANKPLTYLRIIDAAYKAYTPCSEFNPIWLTNMIPLFEKHSGPIVNMLDMSAGRGARMVACASKGINYLGIDPCECANAKYDLMKKYVQYCGTTSQIEFIKSGFEADWTMPEFFKGKQFDLMFTSPPYFDLEIYEDTPGQSIKKFSNLENWLENFLKVCMIKILSLLRPGGIMAMNIDNPVHIKKDYVNPMLNFKFDNAKYIGVIRINYGAKFHTWCWQKK